MASTVTNSIPLPSVEGTQFPNGDLPPTILLSPANLHLDTGWYDSRDASQSYLPGHLSRSNKPEKVSLTDKLKKVFGKKDRTSHSSDRSFKVPPRVEGHRHSETYSPSVVEALRNSSAAKIQRHSDIYYSSNNGSSAVQLGEVVSDKTNVPGLQTLKSDLTCSPGENNQEKKIQNDEIFEILPNAQESIHSAASSNLSIPDSVNSPAEKRNNSFLSYGKNKFKSSLQLFAKSLKKAKHHHRDRPLSECPSNEAKEADGPYFQIKGKYFHYNTINADAYKEIFQKQVDSTEGYLATISPGNKGNFRQTLAPPVAEKKSRFIVSSTKTDKQPKNVASRRSGQMTIMAQLLKKPDENHNYNTVGPQDNRDRRPSVTLQDFLEMYKEKNLSAAEAFRKAKAERKRSISQSESETCPHIGNPKSYHTCKPFPFITPVITVTSDEDRNETEVPQNMCACAKQTNEGTSDTSSPVEEKKIGEARHSIPEHREVHHETQTGFGTFLPQGKTARQNRFLNRGAVCATDCKAQTQHCRSTSTEGCSSLNPQRAALLPAYDHSLTVSGYPRRASRLAVKKCCRRMSEPNPKYQKWPEMKTNNSSSNDEQRITPSYRKVSANSLGIDIPTDEFHNKLLVWIDKRKGTQILPLPHDGQDVWSENRDENSGICFLAKRYKCYNVMPTSGKLVLFDSELPVTAAFEAFTFNRVRSAPIWDATKKQLTGILTISDFIDVLLICAQQPELFEKITEQNISDWKSLSNKAKFEANGSLDNSAICDSMEQTATSSSSESNGESTDFGDSNTYNVVPSTEVREESKFEESKRKATLELKISELDKSSADLFSTAASDDHKTDKTDSKEISSVDTSPDVSPQSSVNKRPFPMIRSSSLEHDNGSISFDTGLISVESDDTLYDAISVLKTFGFHRVLVMDYSDNDPLYILTYKRILYFIYVMMDTVNIPPFMNSSIKVLNVGTFTNLVTITYDTTLKEALSLLQWRSVSAIPVLDADGKVVDLYTKEDVMNLVYNNKFTQLNSTIEEILHDKRRIFEGLFKCKESDSLMAVVQYFISSKAHRLVVTGDDNKLQGIISLSDVVNFMVLGCQPNDEGLQLTSE